MQVVFGRLWQGFLLLAFACAGLHLAYLPVVLADAGAGQNISGDLRKSATWDWPAISVFEQQVLSYLDQLNATETQRRAVLATWDATRQQAQGPALLDRLLTLGGVVEPRIAKLNEQLSDPTAATVHPQELAWLSSDVPGWLQDTIRLACGRALAQRRLYDEALEILSGLQINQVCDPASLIFYRATCEHHLLKRKECLADAKLLLERQAEIPVRFTQLAQLMAADIEPLKSDSLDEVARLMRDVERRLDLGRAGKRVRDEEEEIVKKLDKLIEDIENQMQEAQQQSQQNGGQSNPAQSSPMQDSQIAGGSGPGDVDQKDVGNRAGWGNLPPAERQQALQRLTEELPSHYREVIEGYFRQLAKDRGR